MKQETEVEVKISKLVNEFRKKEDKLISKLKEFANKRRTPKPFKDALEQLQYGVDMLKGVKPHPKPYNFKQIKEYGRAVANVIMHHRKLREAIDMYKEPYEERHERYERSKQGYFFKRVEKYKVKTAEEKRHFESRKSDEHLYIDEINGETWVSRFGGGTFQVRVDLREDQKEFHRYIDQLDTLERECLDLSHKITSPSFTVKREAIMKY